MTRKTILRGLIPRAWRTAALFSIIGAAANVCAAQSAGKIIAAYIKASGSAKAATKIHSSEWEGAITNSAGQRIGEFTMLTRAPGEFYRQFVLGNGQIAEACNATSCWRESGEGNVYTLFGAEEKREHATAKYLNFALAKYKKLKIGAAYAGSEDLDGHTADILELQIPPGENRRVYFDRTTHLIVKEMIEPAETRAPQGKVEGSLARTAPAGTAGATEEISYSDYRPIEDIMEPFRLTIQQGAQRFQITVESTSFNGDLRPSAFDFPNVSKKPLPDIPQLLKAINANQKKIDELKRDYACMKQEEADKVNGKGEVIKRTTSVYQISYFKGHEIARQIESNGKLLSPTEQKKEDERIQKEVAQYTKEATNPGEKSDDDAGISDFLRIDRFTNPRWERFRGQEVVVFDFGPNPGYKPKKLVEKAIYDLVGTVWVDPQAQEVVRLEARFNNSFKVGGGLVASLQKGSAFQFEQSLVNNQVWLPSYDEAHVGVKVFLIKNVRADVIDRYYDYQRFHVSAKEQIAPPKQ